MVYIFDERNGKLLGSCENRIVADEYVLAKKLSNIKYMEELKMTKYMSTVVYVDGECVYNNKTWWSITAPVVYETYENHVVKDILGQDISKERFRNELNTNINRIIAIDGRPGQIEYNMNIGNEFLSLFRQECILTDFRKDSNTSPMIIFNKLQTVISMMLVGAFREAKQYLQAYKSTLIDDFLTSERIDKYITMLDAADAIDYATEEDYFYTAPPATETK